MKKLTETQLQTVVLITKSFTALNETNDNVQFNLLNVVAVDSELERRKQGRKEVGIHNSGMLVVALETMNSIKAKLSADLKKTDVPLTVTVVQKSTMYSYIEIACPLFTGKGYHSNDIGYPVKIYMVQKSENTEFGGKITGFYFGEKNHQPENSGQTIEDYLNSTYFQKKFTDLMSRSRTRMTKKA